MFRSRRSGLVKRLWKSRYRPEQNEAGGQTEAPSPPPEDLELKATMHSMLKRLKDQQLQSLVAAVESQGAESTACVLLPRGDLQLGRRTVAPHVLCCQIWRYPDLQSSSSNNVTSTSNNSDIRLKPLPCCSNSNSSTVSGSNNNSRSHSNNGNNTSCSSSSSSSQQHRGDNNPSSTTTSSTTTTSFICCNPYHWSRVLEPDLPPPPYSSTVSEKDAGSGLPDASTSSRDQVTTETPPVSTETGGTPPEFRPAQTGENGTRTPPWCHVAYWELRTRVGRLFSVLDATVNVFHDLPHGDGLCLSVLQDEHTKSESIRRTREKIGLGLTLSKEPDGIWVYNRSKHPIFVNTPMLDIPNTRTFSVLKVPPGYSMKMFDYDLSRFVERTRDPQYLDGPFDPNSIRISFAKGWGPCYSRQFITSCPCWIEVLLNVNR